MARKNLTLALLALVVVGSTYIPSLLNGFVWDDQALILGDPTIYSWRNISEGWNKRLFFDQVSSEFFRPLQRLSFTLDYALFEFDAWGYHLVSILWHLGAMAAFAWGSRGLLTSPPDGLDPDKASRVSWTVALIWGVHPLWTSAIGYISGRADPMAACFTWLGIGLISRAALLHEGKVRVRSGHLALAAGACLAAALSKEVGLVSFVLCTLVLPWREGGRRLLFGWLILAALAVGYYLLNRSMLEGVSPGLGSTSPWAARPRLILESMAEYARLVLAPIDLTMDRAAPGELPSVRAATPGWLLTPIGAILLALWVYLALKSRSRLEKLCLLCAGIIYLPTSNLLSLNAALAEHWLYQPLQWLFLAIGLAVARLQVSWPVSTRRLLAVLLGFWVAGLIGRNIWRQFDWRSDETFFLATVMEGGDSARTVANLGRTRSDLHPEKAKELYREALKIDRRLGWVWLQLALVEMKAGRFEAVRKILDNFQIDPGTTIPYWILRAELARATGSGDGLREIRNAIMHDPLNWRVRRRAVEYQLKGGKLLEAMRDLADYCTDAPYRAAAWDLLAEIARQAGSPGWRQAEAEAEARDVHLRARKAREAQKSN